jgi:peptidoglycan-N-acetylglucosamine deacetylase
MEDRMPKITLSFDNGPDPDVTPLVLETLRKHRVRSTFFVVGDKLRDRRALAERAHEEGHWIGNHTYNHLLPLGMNCESGRAAAEIADTQDLIDDLAHRRRFFRPFGGGGHLDQRLLNREALEHLQRHRYTCVLWNAIPEDWIHPNGWVERAVNLCFAEEEVLLVLHDLPTGAMKHLDRFISVVTALGAEFQQDFPDSCVPMEQGTLVRSMEAYIAAY